MKPHERLKKVFGGADGMERLQRRFGLAPSHLYKWMRECEGTTATGHPSPLQRVRDLIDEAFLVDRSGQCARLIAQDSIDYYESIMSDSAAVSAWSPQAEANELLLKATAAVTGLNAHDVERMDERQRAALLESLSALIGSAERVRALINSEQGGKLRGIPMAVNGHR